MCEIRASTNEHTLCDCEIPVMPSPSVGASIDASLSPSQVEVDKESSSADRLRLILQIFELAGQKWVAAAGNVGKAGPS